jgi:hypothetical protein
LPKAHILNRAVGEIHDNSDPIFSNLLPSRASEVRQTIIGTQPGVPTSNSTDSRSLASLQERPEDVATDRQSRRLADSLDSQQAGGFR